MPDVIPAVPIVGDGIVDFPSVGEPKKMADSVVDSAIISVALAGMASEFTASNARRTHRADQTAADASAMWAIAMTTPTQNNALSLRTATESGSGRTRAETNEPYATGAARPSA